MDQPLNIYGWSGLVAGISSFLVGLMVYSKAANRILATKWFIFSITVAIYSIGAYIYSNKNSPDEVLNIVRWIYAFGVVWIAPCFLDFVSEFLSLNNRKTVISNYLTACLFMIFVPTIYFFPTAPWQFGRLYFPLGGLAFKLFTVWWMSLVVYSHILLARKYGDVSVSVRHQIKYFFLATAVGFTGGSTGFFGNFGIDIYPYGNVAVVIYPYIMAYAILRHQLMDIQIIIRRTLVYGILFVSALLLYILFVAHFTRREIRPLANFSIVTSLLSCSMAMFVMSRGPRQKLGMLWALMCLMVGCWSFGFAMMTKAFSFESCIFWQKWIMYTGAIMIPVVFLHFVATLVKVELRRTLFLSYMAAAVFQLVNYTGNLASARIKPPFLFYTEAIFPAYHAYTAYFFVLTIFAHWLLIQKLRTATGATKNQIQYVFIGTAIGFLGGCMTFPLSFNVHVFPIGSYLVVFYLIPVTYAIYKHQLMDIQVVIKKSLIYTLMTATITVIYLVLLTQGAQLLQRYFGISLLATSTLAACLIATMFIPLRQRIQLFVDRYFFKSWQDRTAVREVAAGFSHELKSPLASLSVQLESTIMDIEAIENKKVPFETVLPRIKQNLNLLLGKTMEFGRRIEAVRGVAEPAGEHLEPVDVESVIDNSLAALQDRLSQSHVQVARSQIKDLSRVRSNNKQLEIVMINLIKNALEAMEDREIQRLDLNVQESDGFVSIMVKDSGCGILIQDSDRLFDPYFTTKGRKGTGMGLYLSQQIVQSHGGNITVKSDRGNGTEFCVRLRVFGAGIKAA